MKKKLIGMFIFCLLLMSFGATALAAEKYPYYVTVNLTDNIVTVYEKDDAGEYTEPVKAFYCSVGKSTPEGTFQTKVKYDWRYLFGDVWGQYATRITGHYLFHSVPYFEKDKSTLEYEEYNKLGTTASMGCIRLTVKDAKWIYDNCPVGTTVRMYRGNVNEPLPPAPVQKINKMDLARRGWDPTDPDPQNPWKKGEFRTLVVEPSFLDCATESYYENRTYYLSAEAAEKVFSKVGVNLDFPEEVKIADETATFEQDGERITLSCRVKEGSVYYKLRDLANVAGTEMTWDKETMEIGIVYGENTITLSRQMEVKDAVTLPQKLAAFFLDRG